MNGNLNGVLPIFKEPGFTSHDVVAKLRGILKTKKVGHTGTLDPNAVGALPICIGKATKISDYLMDQPKEYIAEITFGLETDIEDIWGEVIKTSTVLPNKEEIINALDEIDDREIQQLPPMYSAKKIKGKKLYEYAREGRDIDRKPINVYIYRAELLRSYQDKAVIRIKCSKGTYIRTIIKDLGIKLNTSATMSYLLRTESSGIKVEQCYTLSQVQKFHDSLDTMLIPMEISLSHLKKVELDSEYYKQIINGAKIPTTLKITNQNIVFCEGKFIGIGEVLESNHSNILKIKKLLY